MGKSQGISYSLAKCIESNASGQDMAYVTEIRKR
jgi:hypothetical protein